MFLYSTQDVVGEVSYFDLYCLQVARCINRFETEVERERHQEKMHPQEKIY